MPAANLAASSAIADMTSNSSMPGAVVRMSLYCLAKAVCPSRSSFTNTSSSVTEDVTKGRLLCRLSRKGLKEVVDKHYDPQ